MSLFPSLMGHCKAQVFVGPYDISHMPVSLLRCCILTVDCMRWIWLSLRLYKSIWVEGFTLHFSQVESVHSSGLHLKMDFQEGDQDGKVQDFMTSHLQPLSQFPKLSPPFSRQKNELFEDWDHCLFICVLGVCRASSSLEGLRANPSPCLSQLLKAPLIPWLTSPHHTTFAPLCSILTWPSF